MADKTATNTKKTAKNMKNHKNNKRECLCACATHIMYYAGIPAHCLFMRGAECEFLVVLRFMRPLYLFKRSFRRENACQGLLNDFSLRIFTQFSFF